MASSKIEAAKQPQILEQNTRIGTVIKKPKLDLEKSVPSINTELFQASITSSSKEGVKHPNTSLQPSRAVTLSYQNDESIPSILDHEKHPSKPFPLNGVTLSYKNDDSIPIIRNLAEFQRNIPTSETEDNQKMKTTLCKEDNTEE